MQMITALVPLAMASICGTTPPKLDDRLQPGHLARLGEIHGTALDRAVRR